MKRNGFTLIELVVVIVILGILAVSAAPRFLNLTSDARVSVLKGAQAAVKGMDSLVYSKAVINGVERNGDKAVKIDGKRVNLINGHLKLDTKNNVAQFLDTDMNYHVKQNGATDGGELVIYGGKEIRNVETVKEGGCFLLVTQPDSKKGEYRYAIIDQNC
ncbi:type II secretion system protein [Vibrio mediterranei]|uniref:type II secretion system protein n=2 Tax=Vibrio TaxID=662 RepID=UPI0023D88D44|nr:type II secretion system protein [Vibrio mediterranei]